jgi:hypothetical protein
VTLLQLLTTAAWQQQKYYTPINGNDKKCNSRVHHGTLHIKSQNHRAKHQGAKPPASNATAPQSSIHCMPTVNPTLHNHEQHTYCTILTLHVHAHQTASISLHSTHVAHTQHCTTLHITHVSHHRTSHMLHTTNITQHYATHVLNIIAHHTCCTPPTLHNTRDKHRHTSHMLHTSNIVGLRHTT